MALDRIYSVGELREFESRVAEAFGAAQIRAPVHLSGGNEEALIKVFSGVQPQDWVLSTWRSHYHALLKGVPPDWLFREILAGHSMHIMNAEYRFLSSSIMAGMVPIGIGIALGIQMLNEDARVWVFVGDMAARSGLFFESCQYAQGHHLPVTFVVEDNRMSVNTPTSAVWGDSTVWSKGGEGMKVIHYDYDSIYPHQGIGSWVEFG